MLLAQITDLHVRPDNAPLSGRIFTRRMTADAIAALNEIAPDLVILTGDLTDSGTPEEYALLRAELDRLVPPYFMIPGNHDMRDPMRAAFPEHSYLPAEGPMNWVVDEHPVRIIGLDSIVEGQSHGELAPETLSWLAARLSEAARPTIVALHHPPFATGMNGMDGIFCRNGAALAAIIARHAHVERVIAGHVHRPIATRWAGTTAMIAPAVVHQLALSFGDAPMGWTFEPPAALLHRWTPGGGLISHTHYLGQFDGPHRFGA